MPRELPNDPDLESLRKQAKRLLRDAHAGDAGALRRMREAPRLTGLDDARFFATAQLADAQHVLAREHGFASWPKLKQHSEDLQPLEAQAARFLRQIRTGESAGARRLLARRPEIAGAGLHASCAVLDAAAVARLLAADATHAMAPDGEMRWTPLLYVCASPLDSTIPNHDARAVQCATLLLDAGADPNSFSLQDGGSGHRLAALYYACVANRIGVVKLLLERGARPDDHESVFHSAELDHPECLELLLAHGADLSGRDSVFDNTPLRFLAGYRPGQPGADPALCGVRWLLEHGADPNVVSNPHAETPIHRAAIGGNLEQVRLLLEFGAEGRKQRGDGRTPYALALRAGREDVVALLRERGLADAATPPVDELLAACLRADESAARSLLASHPGNIAAFTHEDRSRLAEAAHDGRDAAVLLMLRLGFDPLWEAEWCGTALHWAAWMGNVALVRELVARGIPVNRVDCNFASSPLAWAAHGSTNCRAADDDYCAIVTMLLDAGSNREPSINKWGVPPENLGSARVAGLLAQRGFTR